MDRIEYCKAFFWRIFSNICAYFLKIDRDYVNIGVYYTCKCFMGLRYWINRFKPIFQISPCPGVNVAKLQIFVTDGVSE
jgi:hypothetical protein